MRRHDLKAMAVAALVLPMGSCTALKTGEDLPVGEEVEFEVHVKPILEERCLQCHNRAAAPQRVSFETRELAMAPGAHGSAIIPGDPDNSRIVNFINAPRDQAVAMPKAGHVVPEEEAETLREWIAAGADWPDGEAGRLSPK